MVKYEHTSPDRIFSALANPTRRAILEALRSGSRSISDLAEPFDMSLVGVSKHVHLLEEADLIRIRREGRSRVCRLQPEPLRIADRWVQQFRSFWRDELAQVDRYLRSGGAGADHEASPDDDGRPRAGGEGEPRNSGNGRRSTE